MYLSVKCTDFARFVPLQLAVLSLAFLVLSSLAAIGPAFALTPEQARSHCIDTVGRPLVQECMGSPFNRKPGADLEACKAKARPSVIECIKKALMANGRGNVPLAIPKEASPDASPGTKVLPAAFVPPPRTITDITAILDSEKPDPKEIGERKVRADAKPPVGLPASQLARFYYDRGNARTELGRLKDAIADAEKAIEVVRPDDPLTLLLYDFAGNQNELAGNPKQAMTAALKQIQHVSTPGNRGWLFGGYASLSRLSIQIGDVGQADTYLRRNIDLLREARTSWPHYTTFGHNWEAIVENHRASMFERRGQFREAETSYRLSEQHRRAGLKTTVNQRIAPPEAQLTRYIDSAVLSQARMKMKQGRLAEAESDARRALLSRLKSQGKYHPVMPTFVMGLANVLVEQGRYDEAEKLARTRRPLSAPVVCCRRSWRAANQGDAHAYFPFPIAVKDLGERCVPPCLRERDCYRTVRD